MKMKFNQWTIWIPFVVFVFAMVMACIVGLNAYDYHSNNNQGQMDAGWIDHQQNVVHYRWYNNNWFCDPYINLRCRLNSGTRHIVSEDGAGGLWLERETRVRNFVFWTRVVKVQEIKIKVKE